MVWNEWGRLTRFLESARVAFGREDNLWGALELADAASAKVRVLNGDAKYQVSLAQHREAVSDSWLLHASVLVCYYALAEAAAGDKLGVDDVACLGGIEVWGQRLLDAVKADWNQVKAGKAGAVEVAVVRNTIAHGERSYSQSALNRLHSAGGVSTANVNDPVVLDYATLHEYRSRLKSLLRVAQVRGDETAREDEAT